MESQPIYNNLVSNQSRLIVTLCLPTVVDDKFSLANPSLAAEDEVSQASIFNGQLKAYQIKGMSWLASLYDQVQLAVFSHFVTDLYMYYCRALMAY